MRTLLASVLLATAASGQSLAGGDFVILDDGTNTVHRMTAAGVITTLHSGAPLGTPTGVAVSGNLDVFVSDFGSNTIYKIPKGGSITPHATNVPGAIRIALDEDGSLLVPSLTTSALLRVSTTGQVSTIFSGAPLARPFDVTVDYDGSYLVVEEGTRTQPPALLRITRAGVPTTIWSGSPLRLPHGIALLHDGDYAVIDGIVDCVFRIPRAGGPPVVLVQTPAIINPDSLCADFEGRLLLAEELSTGRRIDLVDRFGVVTPVSNPAPFTNLEGIARAPRLSGPAKGGANQTLNLGLDFGPTDATHLYFLWASLSVHPGIPFGPPDPRGVATNPDLMLSATIGANNAIFSGWAGVLSPTGTGAATLVVPNLVLPQFALYVCGLTIDPRSPLGFKSFANVHTIRF